MTQLQISELTVYVRLLEIPLKAFSLLTIFIHSTSFMVAFSYHRRESERRNHSLARHADILAAVETRLSLLNMTFMKYVDSNLCCFIPGKVKQNCLPKTAGLHCLNRNYSKAVVYLSELFYFSGMSSCEWLCSASVEKLVEKAIFCVISILKDLIVKHAVEALLFFRKACQEFILYSR